MDTRTHIVYVDPDCNDSVAPAVRAVGLDLECVESDEACLDRLESADCVITEYDLGPAARTGLDLYRAIRRRAPDVPVVLYTDAGNEAIAGEALAAGVAGYVPKSQGVETLVTRVLEAIVETETGADIGHDSESGPNSDPESDSNSEPDPDSESSDPFSIAKTHDERNEPFLESSADHVQLIVEQSPFAIIKWTPEFEVRHWNEAAADLFGYTAAEAVGRHATDLVVPQERHDAITDWWSTWLDDEPSTNHGISRNVDKDGTSFRCEWSTTPLVDADGTVRGALSFVRDATSEFRRSLALETLQETTQALMQTSSETEIGALVIDATDEIIDDVLAGIRVYDEDANRLDLVAVSDRLQEQTAQFTPVGPGDDPLWSTYASGSPTVIEDASAEMVPYDLTDEVGNAVIYPLGDYGLLTVAASGTATIEEIDLTLIRILAATAEAAFDQAARKRELERAKTVVEAVGDSLYAVDTEGTLVTVNDTMVEITGYDRNTLVGLHASEVLTEESFERGVREVERLAAGDSDGDGDEVATYDVDIVTASGDLVPCEVNTTLLEGEGDLSGSVGILRDVTDRKLMEQELVDHREKMEKLHEIASRLDSCETAQDVYDLTVETAEDVLEFDVCVVDRVDGEYLETVAVSSTIHEDGFSSRAPIDEGIAGKTYRNDRTYRLDDLRADEEATPERDSYRSVLSAPIGDRGIFQAVSTDVGAFDRADQELTELLLSHVSDTLDRLAFETRLKAERDRFAALFENVPDAIVSTKRVPDGPIVEQVNPAFERIFGYEESELLEKPLDSFIVPPDRFEHAQEINERGTRGEAVEAEVKRRTSDGLRDFMMRVVPMDTNGSTDRAFGLYTDITAQKQHQKRVEILNRVLRHDLRNGMNIINGCAEMLAEAVEDEDDRDFAEAIQERAGELISLAEKTRAVERTLDRDGAAAGPVDVVDCVETALGRIDAEYPAVDIGCALPDRAHARADELLGDAIFHVLENAIEHSDRAEPTIEIGLEVDDDDTLTLTIADDGPGIPGEERALLQEDEEITQLRHASGLGLWLVNWVITQSGGQLTFQENDPRGTVVRMQIPTADVPTRSASIDGTATSD
ncbi:PAS domain S-box protein [Natronosalvus halobius]|uniref:PAS domain S-box protein n=1 Tax=Natronosalvus halobius TaxID=2953746 RepID=UPI00209FA1ED|nr:PAS domain S-box protein [Natronosalvus halobius]USZ71297.1 PAS domain S-box protein [Natronosalvus halobius]